MKTCSYCKQSKDESEFGLRNDSVDKLTNDCSDCRKIRQKQRRLADPLAKEKQKAWYEANKEKVAAKTRVWQEANKDRKELVSKQWRKDNPDKVKGAFLRRKYWPNLSSQEALDNYNNLVIKFNNSCGICKRHRDLFNKDLCVDHNHITGQVRGLLCHECNNMLGLLRVDSTETSLLTATLEYISNSNSESIQ